MVSSPAKAAVCQEQGKLHRQTIHVLHRITYSQKQVWSGRLHMRPIQWHLKQHWYVSEILEEIIPIPKSLHPHLDWWLDERNVSSGSTVASPRPCSTNVYRRLKRRLGHTLRGLHCKRRMVRHRRSPPPYQFPRVKGSVSGPQELQAYLMGPDCVSGNRQHNCGILHQQGGWYEIRLSVCPSLEASVLEPPQGNSPEGKTHPRSLECNSRQIVQTRFNPVQPKTSQVCVTGTGSKSLGSRRLEPPMREFGCLRLSNSLTTQQSSIQSDGPGLSQNDTDCTGVARHALVLGPGHLSVQIPFMLLLQWDLLTQPFNRLLHRDLKNLNLHSWLQEPPSFRNKGSLKKWQQELRLLRDSQPEPSTNQNGLFLCHQHLCCLAYRDCFVISFCGIVCQRRRLSLSHFLILCNSRHVSVVDVTNLEQNLQEKITLNSLQYTAVQTNFGFKIGTIFLVFGRYFIC